MKTIYAGIYEIETKSLTTRRTYHFSSPEMRAHFETLAIEQLGARCIGQNIEHIMTGAEALADLKKEKARFDAM